MVWAWAPLIAAAAQHAVRVHGTTVIEVAGWQDRGNGTTQGRLAGTMWHDTVTGPGWSRDAIVRLLRDGNGRVAGPIANVGLERDGTLLLIAAGRAYHAGAGSWPGILSGNLNSCGIEVCNAGAGSGEPWTPIQIAVAATFTAELHRLGGLAPDRLVMHKEWAPTRKVDPWSIGGPQARAGLVEEDDTMPVTDPADVRYYQAILANSWGPPHDKAGPPYDIGAIDGIVGPKTRAAIEDWQRRRGIAVTGTLTVTTCGTLQSHANRAYATSEANRAAAGAGSVELEKKVAALAAAVDGKAPAGHSHTGRVTVT